MDLEDIANRVIRGDYGNGEERKRRLGPLYGFVQNEVNRKLNCPKWHNPFDYW